LAIERPSKCHLRPPSRSRGRDERRPRGRWAGPGPGRPDPARPAGRQPAGHARSPY